MKAPGSFLSPDKVASAVRVQVGVAAGIVIVAGVVDSEQCEENKSWPLLVWSLVQCYI